jgi:hypothetical protein
MRGLYNVAWLGQVFVTKKNASLNRILHKLITGAGRLSTAFTDRHTCTDGRAIITVWPAHQTLQKKKKNAPMVPIIWRLSLTAGVGATIGEYSQQPVGVCCKLS